MTNVKIITYKGREYRYVIDTEPAPYCDFCVFREICVDAVSGKIAIEDSPLPLCEKLSEEFDTHYANFQEYNRE